MQKKLGLVAGLWLIISGVLAAAPPHPLVYQSNVFSPKSGKFAGQKLPPKKLNFPQYTIARKAPISGTLKVLALLIQFQDVKFASDHNPAYFQELLLNQTAGYPSLYNYYKEVSYAQLQIEGAVSSAAYESDYPVGHYGQDGDWIDSANDDIFNLVSEAVKKADQDIDFSQYDSDHDGTVDHLILIHAGEGQEYSGSDNDIWSHRWEIGGGDTAGYLTNDGVYVRGYTLESENSPVGIFAHEFAHDLGLPELYKDSMNPVVGDWCLMDHGCWLPRSGGYTGTNPAHISDWCKYYLGWIDPLEVSSSTYNIRLNPGESDDQSFRKIPIGDGGSAEYFLISYRKRNEVGIIFDQALPGEGLLIWHIDDTIARDIQRIDNSEVNSGYPHLGIDLIEADGTGTNFGDSGDPFPGRTPIFSAPQSNAFNGQPSNISFTNIRFSGGGTMQLNVVFGGLYPAIMPQARIYPNPMRLNAAAQMNFEQIGLNGKIEIFTVNGEMVRRLSDDDWDGNVVWDLKNKTGMKVASGIYIYLISDRYGKRTGKFAVVK